ncbi:uncharacterized protein LOC106170630 isoform X2 [Lingula anatina]|uniref:Uncharacterized protein LOC106170630 isoform X2 n=1 Tax=Lingula anatina TaxID=7574 RepID=A0A1S3J734_LINAN|nr:uncharacterized protein LOC106170630 isoform X2 [Lingula anatina]|eukprot:XP_013406056.1 uncharacterized protein LOC106170630 isoform X2 [Lingula anatina]
MHGLQASPRKTEYPFGDKKSFGFKCRTAAFQIMRKPKGFMVLVSVTAFFIFLSLNLNMDTWHHKKWLALKNFSDFIIALERRRMMNLAPPSWGGYEFNFSKKIYTLKDCSDFINGLERRRMINLVPPTWGELEVKFLKTGIKLGGQWKPENCTAQTHVAIIIPFRDRDAHLRIFLNNMHPFLQKQKLDYRIYIVEQKATTIFNRGLLMNIGFVESAKIDKDSYDCFALHDVDLLPENEWNFYNCAEKVKHMSANVDKFKEGLLYPTIIGGVTMLTKSQYRQVNGFPNTYFGWGGEDDDLYIRVDKNGGLTRVPFDIGRYRMIKHNPDSGNPLNLLRHSLLHYAKLRWEMDGLSSLEGTYTVLKTDEFLLYTRIYVDVDPNAVYTNIKAKSNHIFGSDFQRLIKWTEKKECGCKNGGICVQSNDLRSQRTCTCPYPYGGLHCERNLTCPPQFEVMFGTSCYSFNTTLDGSFYKGKVSCESIGARLVAVNDEKEHRFITQYLAADVARSDRCWWTSATDEASEGRWVLSGWGNIPAPFTAWYPGAPDNEGGNEDCAKYLRDRDYWDDSQCSKICNFICETDAI